MKTIRVFLAVSALLMAIGGVFASTTVDNVYYVFTPGSPATCEEFETELTCQTLGDFVCSTQVVLRPNAVVGTNQCGPELRRN